MGASTLKEAESVHILTIIDNYVDLLLTDTMHLTRPRVEIGETISMDSLLSEHGLSLLVSVRGDDELFTVLFDFGYSPVGVPRNMRKLGVAPSSIDALVLSHGHMDHSGALEGLADMLPEGLPLVYHPGVLFKPRYIALEDGTKRRFPPSPVERQTIRRKFDCQESAGPTVLGDGMLLVSGEVTRTTDFEKGPPNAFMEKGGRLIHDPVADDQALIVAVRGKGLVIISGCSHAGIVNTILHAQRLTGIQRVYAVVGGFHLSGPLAEPVIERTIQAIEVLTPEVIVPMHCTGWRAMQRFHDQFGEVCGLNSVGSCINL
jgi:7,8-dihydropterin-6-yl-methyl-4-(beta-D-ribofuranosyl)aminobenzene 5'-phosphate synthase